MDSTPLSSSRFSDTVNRIVLRVACTEGHEDSTAHNRALDSGPLTLQELSELSLLCAALNDTKNGNQNPFGFATVEADQLLGLLELLDRHINNAVAIDFLRDALEILHGGDGRNEALDQWLRKTGSHKIQVLKSGLEAASVVLSIASSPGVDRRALNGDSIEASITLARLHLNKNLIPALNRTGHLISIKENASPSPTRKRRRSAGEHDYVLPPINDLSKVYRYLLSTINAEEVLLERLEQLVHSIPLDDQQILMLTSGVLPALEINCNANPALKGSEGQRLQLCMISIVTAAFRRYPTHRDTILEDVYPLLLRLPTGKRSLRSYPLRYSSFSSAKALFELNKAVVGDIICKKQPPNHIQMITALILSLVQACVKRPTYLIAGESAESSQANSFVSGLTDAKKIVECFVEDLVKRCGRTKDGGQEFRPVLTNLVEDLLLVLLIPEFPAAASILDSLVRRLLQDLNSASSFAPSKTPSPESTFLTVAFDCLGKIFAVEARILAVQKDRPIEIKQVQSTMGSSTEVSISCYCNCKEQNDVLIIGCQSCRIYFHGCCVGVSDVPDEWTCDSCRLGNILERERRKQQECGVDEYIDEVYAVSHSFQSILSHRLGVMNIDDAKKFWMANWVGELQQKWIPSSQSVAPRKLVLELLEFWESPGPSGEDATEEGSVRLILYLAAKSSILTSWFRYQLQFILKIMSDTGSQNLRKLSLKSIEKAIEGDPNQMRIKAIQSSVILRLTDDSISVREAALSLIGSFVVQSPSLAMVYHQALLKCLEDSGVSVRKRAVRIFESILSVHPAYKGRATALSAMLKRAIDPKEEESVRDLINDLICSLWLDGNQKPMRSAALTPDLFSTPGLQESPLARAPSSAGIVTPTPPVSEKTRLNVTTKPYMAAMQMMEVVRSAGSGEYLETLLEKVGQKDSEKAIKNLAVSKDHFTKIVESLFELLLSIEEEMNKRSVRDGKDLVATLETIAVLTKLAPQPVCDKVETVLPYLKGDNGAAKDDEPAIIAATCDIIHRLTCMLGERFVARLSPKLVSKDLKQISFRFGPSAFRSAIRAFSSLASHSEGSFSVMLLELARQFYTFLVKRSDTQNFEREPQSIRGNVHRALTVLGIICQYRVNADSVETSWDEEVSSDVAPSLVPPGELNWSNVLLACYRLFSSFLAKEDMSTQCVALRALGGIFVSQPRLLLQLDSEGQIRKLMADSAPVPLQLEALGCWCNILETEEERIDGGLARVKMESDGNLSLAKRISGDQDGDATLFGGVLTNHAGRLFDLTRSRESSVRFAVLKVIGILLRQGLVNPNEAVPYLFAMQGDTENSQIRSLALEYLSIEGEKRPDTLRRRICAGVKHAFEFQRLISNDEKQASAIVVFQEGKKTSIQCVFSRVFKDCISSSRKQRQGFFKNLISLFRLNSAQQDKSKSGSSDLLLLSFASQILAHLEYSTAEDPLYIIHHISSAVALQGTDTLDRMTALLRDVGLAASDQCDDDLQIVDQLEKTAMTRFPSRTKEAGPLSLPHFQLNAFAELSRNGIALSLLLRLKVFLRNAYNLTNTRCLEYDPNTTERDADKSVIKADICTPFDASVPLNLVDKSGRPDKDVLIRHYAEFRKLMREENSMDADMIVSVNDDTQDDAEII